MSAVKFLAGIVVGVLLTLGIVMVLPEKPPAPPLVMPPALPPTPVITSCVQTTYDQIVPVLDPGGNMMFYMDTQGIETKSDQLFDLLRRLVKFGAKGNQGDTEMAMKAIDVAASLFKSSGLMEIDGFGSSSIETASGRFHGKSIVHRKLKQVDDGLIWSLMQSKDPATKGSDLLKVMPANAAIVVGGDCNLEEFRNWLKKTIKANGSAEVIAGFDSFEKEAAAAGFSLDNIFASYGGRMAMVITIDEKQKLPVPPLQKPIALPMAALVVEVSDGKLFDLIAAQLTKDAKLKVTGTADHRQILLAESAAQLSPALNPVLVQDGKLLILATLPALADSILETRTKGEGMLTTSDFLDWSAHVGVEANGFCYISPAATALVADLRDQGLEMFKMMNAEAANEFGGVAKSVYNLPTGYSAYTVDKKGIFIRSNVQRELPPPPVKKPE